MEKKVKQGEEKVEVTREEWEKPLKEKREEQREGGPRRGRGLERDEKRTQEEEEEEEEGGAGAAEAAAEPAAPAIKASSQLQ